MSATKEGKGETDRGDISIEHDNSDLQKRVREVESKIMELELAQKFRSLSLSKGPPVEEFSTLRPAYRSRGNRIAEAQRIMNEQAHKDVPERAVKNA